MLYVVEIENQDGKKATKEYEAKSSNELVIVVQRDLTLYPRVRLVGAWEKGHPTRTVFRARR